VQDFKGKLSQNFY